MGEKKVLFEFCIFLRFLERFCIKDIDLCDGEFFVVNCSFRLYYFVDEFVGFVSEVLFEIIFSLCDKFL